MASVCSGPEKSFHGAPATRMQDGALFVGQRIERLERAWARGYEEEICQTFQALFPRLSAPARLAMWEWV